MRQEQNFTWFQIWDPNFKAVLCLYSRFDAEIIFYIFLAWILKELGLDRKEKQTNIADFYSFKFSQDSVFFEFLTS